MEKANKDIRDMELFIINKISPDPSLPKRGTNTNAIIPVSLRGVLLRWDDEAISRKREIATLRSR